MVENPPNEDWVIDAADHLEWSCQIAALVSPPS